MESQARFLLMAGNNTSALPGFRQIMVNVPDRSIIFLIERLLLHNHIALIELKERF